MNASKLAKELVDSYSDFLQYTNKLSGKDYEYAAANKWSAAQQENHLIKSVEPVLLAMQLPKFALRLFFGKAKRPSKIYEELVLKYQDKLLAGGVATGRFIPKIITFTQKEKQQKQLKKVVSKLADRVADCNEKDLDFIILPHPLLGKITLREMMYFTIFHVQHHKKLIAQYL